MARTMRIMIGDVIADDGNEAYGYRTAVRLITVPLMSVHYHGLQRLLKGRSHCHDWTLCLIEPHAYTIYDIYVPSYAASGVRVMARE